MHIGQLLTRAAQRHPSHTAWFKGDTAVPYSEVERRVTWLARALRGLGLADGARVGMLLPNSPEAIEVMFATMRAGLVIVPLNIRLHPDEHATILEDAGCSLLLYGADFTPLLPSLRQRLPELKLCVVGQVSTGDLNYEQLLETERRKEEQLAKQGAKQPPKQEPQPGPEHLAWLFYTSGTTGKPKGVMLTHRNLLTLVSVNLMDLNSPQPGDVLLHALALSFAGGFFMLHHVARAVTHVFLPRFDPVVFFQMVAKHKVTTVALVPTMINMLVRSPARTGYDLSSLHTIFYGGAPMHAERLTEALAAFGPIFLQSYGLGESPLTITVLGKDEHTGTRSQSAGRVTSLVSLRIQDEDWKPVKQGEEGEIAVSSDLVMSGYWNRKEATRDVLRDGWFRTGDIGHMDEDGYLYISDRKKDLIKSGGATVSPREVEEIIHQHPAVQEVAIIGVPDDTWGEAVKALVVLRQGTSTTEPELIAFCKDRLASFKKPRSVEFVQDLPKSANNKVLRRELRERYWQGRARKV